MTTDNTTCPCATCSNPACTCKGQAPVPGGCCCGAVCACGDACRCPPSCGCPATKAKKG